MPFTVHELPRAKWDKRHIVEWLFARSPQGAAVWLNAYDQMIERLAAAADSYPVAHENQDLELEVKQILFKTKRGRIYRALFHIDGRDAYVLRVRGPGQAPITPRDLAS
jgi:hypothetical protein